MGSLSEYIVSMISTLQIVPRIADKFNESLHFERTYLILCGLQQDLCCEFLNCKSGTGGAAFNSRTTSTR